MKKFINVIVPLVIILVSGCSSVAKYDPGHSQAYNVVRANGMYEGIRDVQVNKNEYRVITNSLDNATVAPVLHSSPALGLSGLQSLGIGVIGWLAEGEAHGARNSAMAWMPSSYANNEEDSLVTLLKMMKTAAKETLLEMGADPNIYFFDQSEIERRKIKTAFNTGNHWVNVNFQMPGSGCPELNGGIGKCVIKMKLVEPDRKQMPDFVNADSKEGFVFSSADNHFYNKVDITLPNESSFSISDFYLKLSQRMPPWFFLYIAPESVKGPDGELVRYPFVLNQGSVSLFVKPS